MTISHDETPFCPEVTRLDKGKFNYSSEFVIYTMQQKLPEKCQGYKPV